MVGYICYFGTKERLVVEKSYKPKVKFFEGLKEVAKNKYFWIINSSTVLGFGRLMILGTQYYVAMNMLHSTALEGIFTTVIATASIPAMLLGPILLKKWDKRNWVIASYFFSAFISGIMLLMSYVGFFWAATPWIFIALMYINTLLSTINIVASPLIGAEYMDYTQLKTGRRLDGFMGQVGGMFVTLIGMGTGYIIPALLKSVGVITGQEYADPVNGMNVLKDAFIIWGWVSVISGIIAAIPYFFYDLNETKHKKIMDELKKIALTKDKEEGNLGANDYAEAFRLGVVDQAFAEANMITLRAAQAAETAEEAALGGYGTDSSSLRTQTADDADGRGEDESTAAMPEEEDKKE